MFYLKDAHTYAYIHFRRQTCIYTLSQNYACTHTNESLYMYNLLVRM